MQEIQISMQEIQISMREIQGKSKKRSKTSLDNYYLECLKVRDGRKEKKARISVRKRILTNSHASHAIKQSPLLTDKSLGRPFYFTSFPLFF